jgi:type II secretory pathway component PulF
MRYLLISFLRKPGGQIDEQARFVKRIRTSDLTQSNIILDYGLRKIEKCVVEGNKLDRSFDQLHEYYKKVYPQIIAQLEKEGPEMAKRRETGK